MGFVQFEVMLFVCATVNIAIFWTAKLNNIKMSDSVLSRVIEMMETLLYAKGKLAVPANCGVLAFGCKEHHFK